MPELALLGWVGSPSRRVAFAMPAPKGSETSQRCLHAAMRCS